MKILPRRGKGVPDRFRDADYEYLIEKVPTRKVFFGRVMFPKLIEKSYFWYLIFVFRVCNA